MPINLSIGLKFKLISKNYSEYIKKQFYDWLCWSYFVFIIKYLQSVIHDEPFFYMGLIFFFFWENWWALYKENIKNLQRLTSQPHPCPLSGVPNRFNWLLHLSFQPSFLSLFVFFSLTRFILVNFSFLLKL